MVMLMVMLIMAQALETWSIDLPLVSRAFHVLFESQTLHKTQNYQYLKYVVLVQSKPERL